MAALPSSSLSGPEEILQCRAKHLFYFLLGTYFVVLHYCQAYQECQPIKLTHRPLRTKKYKVPYTSRSSLR